MTMYNRYQLEVLLTTAGLGMVILGTSQIEHPANRKAAATYAMMIICGMVMLMFGVLMMLVDIIIYGQD